MQKRVIITVVGKDTVGIIARICTYLSEHQINILDISQTIVQEFFDMIMIVDTARCDRAYSELADDLEKVGKEVGVDVRCQSEEIFDMMHRI